ncbi:MAG: hypothetical protein ACYTFM_02900, partial [Planctomycetota bacterium]
TWLFTDENEGIKFYFPTSVTIAPGGRILLVKNLAAFTAEYGTPSVPTFEWLEGRLSNAGEKINLLKPGEPELDGFVPYYRVDRVNYSDGYHHENFRELDFNDPWPTSETTLTTGQQALHPQAYNKQYLAKHQSCESNLIRSFFSSAVFTLFSPTPHPLFPKL